jgi:DNA excision repair protein ERCC-2
MNYKEFFPYHQYRISQEKIIEQIENNARKSNNILLSAPNGTGKTIIALSALLPVAIKNDLKILYLCRTHSQNARVIKELMKISDSLLKIDNDLKINGLSIRGRNEMCLNKILKDLNPDPREAMSICKDLRKNRNCVHFINLLKKRNKVKNPTLISPEILNQPVDADILIDLCKDQKLCPYFLSKFLLPEMRIIICNYQWIFNPFIRYSFLKFIGKELQDCILVLDECHNIIDVATEVNSQRISPYLLNLCLRDLEKYRSPGIMQNFIKILQQHLERKKRKLNVVEKEINPEKILNSIILKLGYTDLNQFTNFINDLYEYSVAIHEEKVANGEFARDYLGSLAEFWIKWIKTFTLEKYFFCYTIRKTKNKKSIAMEIIALDPREIATPILKSCFTSLHLSGTVNPYVYNNLMGLMQSGKSYKGIIAESPFDKKNIRALITEGVDTRKENRTPLMFKKMIEKIDEILYCTPDNVGIFCASYKVLKALLENGIENIASNNNKKLFVEKPGLSASENALLVEDFKSMVKNPDIGAVLLGVCGGRNSEGEDYPGNTMNAVIIAGFPYHLPTPRTEAKIQYYDKVFNNQGWNFAYLYPAIQRANQASGRPIRKLTDKGAIIFMDSRFKQKYKWISDWIQKEIEIIPDQRNAIIQSLYPFWNN